MTREDAAPTTIHPLPTRRTPVVRLLVVIATIAAALGCQVMAPSSSTPRSPIARSSPTAARPIDDPRGEHRRRLGEADGAVPAGTTVFDDGIPAVAKLDPGLLDALRQAATDAAADGIGILVTSGWRSAAYQERLFRQAVSEHGSEHEAARWVATADTSPHVSGDAIDIGDAEAIDWLSRYGAAYGLCQIYRNEPWHFELRPAAVDDGCPPMYADPAQDPRLQP